MTLERMGCGVDGVGGGFSLKGSSSGGRSKQRQQALPLDTGACREGIS